MAAPLRADRSVYPAETAAPLGLEQECSELFPGLGRSRTRRRKRFPDSAAMRSFGIDLVRDRRPTTTEMCRFAVLLDESGGADIRRLGAAIFKIGAGSRFPRRDRRRHDHPCAVLDQECDGARSRHQSDQEGDSMSLAWRRMSGRQRDPESSARGRDRAKHRRRPVSAICCMAKRRTCGGGLSRPARRSSGGAARRAVFTVAATARTAFSTRPEQTKNQDLEDFVQGGTISMMVRVRLRKVTIAA